MSLGENMQYLRKRENLTQEQLAERLDVSRQSISKWESDTSFPEMDKLLQICTMFSCNMDTLIRGSLEDSNVEDTAMYDAQMNDFSKYIAAAVGIIILGPAVSTLLEGFGFLPSDLIHIITLIFVLVGAMISIIKGMQKSSFCKRYPHIEQFYSDETIYAFERKFPVLITAGVGLIFFGLMIAVIGFQLPLPPRFNENIYNGAFLILVAVGASIIVYAGLQKSKYNLKEYNRENSSVLQVNDSRVGKWCSCIMLTATCLFLIFVVYSLASSRNQLLAYSWIFFAVGGLLCGIVSIIGKQDNT